MNKKKKIIIIFIVTFVIVGIIVGVLLYLKKKNRDKKVVDVIPVSNYAMDAEMYEYYGGLYGYVATNTEQKIYLSSSDIVEEVKVTEGQQVKANDVIMVYDTTSKELELQMSAAQVEQARVDVLVAERELEELKKIVPLEDLPPAPTPEPTPEPEEVMPEVSSPTDGVEVQPAPEPMPEPTSEPTPEPTPEPEEEVYTRAELQKLIAEKEAEIKKLKIDYQLAQIDYEMLEYQCDTGEVKCNFDGFVTSVKDPEEAILNNEPYIVIAGNDSCIVKASIGELSLDKIQIGDELEMYSYETGMYYTGKITNISDIPTEQGGYSSFVESYYPITISVNEPDGLTTGMGMEVTPPSNEEETPGAYYLSLAYVVYENGRYYVMKDNNGKLEKAYVKTGKIMWGDSIKILGGLSMNDYIAFPYSEDAKEGVRTQKSEGMGMFY